MLSTNHFHSFGKRKICYSWFIRIFVFALWLSCIYFPSAISNVCLSHAEGLMRRDLFIVFVRCAIAKRCCRVGIWHVTVSTVNMEDLSKFSVTSSETNKEVDVGWNSIPKPVMMNPFVANTVPVRDVSLMFKEENFNQIAEETKLITLPSKRWNLNQIVCGTKLMLKKSKRTLTRTFSLASNNCQKFIRTGLKINF